MKNTSGKKSLFKKSGKYYVMIGLFIMTIAVAHFALQMIFIQKENLQAVETAVEVEKNIEPNIEKNSPVKQVVEIEPEQVEVKKVEVITIPEYVKPAPRQQKEAVHAPKPVRKKEVRETRAERLRRAERILTGV
jgi:outer membrane biosynthesis protein TonB